MGMTITKEIMEQYEQIRQMGLCNMFDHYCVIDIADRFGLYALASLDRKSYIDILSNFSKYMKEFEIEQE